MRTKPVIAILVLFLMALAVPAGADGRPLEAVLSGASEAPNPGDPDGAGFVRLELNQGQGTVCYTIDLTGVDLPAAGHIHVAPPGLAGPVVLTLLGGPANAAPATTPPAPASYPASACVEGVSEDLIKAIRQNPEAYYVNLHNAAFPGGAVRGQLSKSNF